MKTLAEIADAHLEPWFRDGVSIPSDGKLTLRERVMDAIQEALDTVDDKYLASELARVGKDRDSWMKAFLNRGEELRAAKKALDDPAESPLYLPVMLHIERMEELEVKLAVMRAQRDEAVQNLSDYKTMIHDPAP